MEPIKDIIPQVIESISQKKPEAQSKLQRIWQSIVGEKSGQHTVIGGFKDNALLVLVDSPAYLFQMNLKKRKFLEQLKEEFPELKEINFKIGKTK